MCQLPWPKNELKAQSNSQTGLSLLPPSFRSSSPWPAGYSLTLLILPTWLQWLSVCGLYSSATLWLSAIEALMWAECKIITVNKVIGCVAYQFRSNPSIILGLSLRCFLSSLVLRQICSLESELVTCIFMANSVSWWSPIRKRSSGSLASPSGHMRNNLISFQPMATLAIHLFPHSSEAAVHLLNLNNHNNNHSNLHKLHEHNSLLSLGKVSDLAVTRQSHLKLQLNQLILQLLRLDAAPQSQAKVPFLVLMESSRDQWTALSTTLISWSISTERTMARDTICRERKRETTAAAVSISRSCKIHLIQSENRQTCCH